MSIFLILEHGRSYTTIGAKFYTNSGGTGFLRYQHMEDLAILLEGV